MQIHYKDNHALTVDSLKSSTQYFQNGKHHIQSNIVNQLKLDITNNKKMCNSAHTDYTDHSDYTDYSDNG